MMTVKCMLFALLACVVWGSHCPHPLSIQDPTLAKSFNVTKFIGAPYYELAKHDYTQPGICGCQRSVKSVAVYPEGQGQYLRDNFTMLCPFDPSAATHKGKVYISPLSFNFTAQPGVLHGHWKVTGKTVFPDTVVAVGEGDQPDEPYRWALEFQCVEGEKQAIFVGVNFYSRSNVGPQADRNYKEMLEASHATGIEQYWNTTKAGLKRLNQTGCFY